MANSYAAANLYLPHGDDWRPFDWSDAWDEKTEESRYEYWEATSDDRNLIYHSASGSAQVLTASGQYAGRQPHEEGYEGEVPEGPLMSGYWPLGDYLRMDLTTDRIAWRMRNLAVCLVKVDETFGVALTGGGMNLSWHLAAGAIAAGYFPWSGLDLDSWEYGLSTVGEQWARRVRAARIRRLRDDRRRAARQLADIEARWR